MHISLAFMTSLPSQNICSFNNNFFLYLKLSLYIGYVLNVHSKRSNNSAFSHHLQRKKKLDVLLFNHFLLLLELHQLNGTNVHGLGVYLPQIASVVIEHCSFNSAVSQPQPVFIASYTFLLWTYTLMAPVLISRLDLKCLNRSDCFWTH